MPATEGSKTAARALKVSCGTSPMDRRQFSFRHAFRIGRAEDCDVVIAHDYVSRVHAQVTFENGNWWVCDVGSSNGIYVNGVRLPRVSVEQNLTICLGIYGPELTLELEPLPLAAKPVTRPSSAEGDRVVAQYIERYFSRQGASDGAGQHTMYLRQAFQHVQSQEKRKYGQIIGALLAVVLGVGVYGFYEHHQVAKQKAMAEELFYSMKSLDIDIANVERIVGDSNSTLGAEEIRKYRQRRQLMENGYDRFLSTLHVYNPRMTEQERLVLRVARIFGECELDMPAGFMQEVEKYIKRWQSSDRYTKALETARVSGYTKLISDEFLSQGLPPQFFYLAMQESNFDRYAVGPMTRKGFAKGLWQFVPETAVKYGLHLGPLVDLSRPDPGDDRAHVDHATKAAARYIKDLYSSDAQASGLLVMACYNWGENQVLPMVRSMPANPRERNFWMLLKNHRDRIPQETYDYVFYIVSAAVIGENPRLFGFEFDNPLLRKVGDEQRQQVQRH
jgi:membrane-bound lytic murein transglycosylase D